MNGALEADEFDTGTFARSGPLDLSGFVGSGADWLERFKPHIEDGKTIVVSPHKVFGPETNDLTLQLRKRRCAVQARTAASGTAASRRTRATTSAPMAAT
jgi:hypothetical protein